MSEGKESNVDHVDYGHDSVEAHYLSWGDGETDRLGMSVGIHRGKYWDLCIDMGVGLFLLWGGGEETGF